MLIGEHWDGGYAFSIRIGSLPVQVQRGGLEKAKKEAPFEEWKGLP